MKITVYLGANEGSDPALKQAVQELGSWIGQSGNALVYGGSRSGLMGTLAESVLAAGGEVTGVEPQFFVDRELQVPPGNAMNASPSSIIFVLRSVMSFVTISCVRPSCCTLEEIAEVMSKVSLGQLDAPCILYDLNGYYSGLKALLAEMIRKGLSSPERQQGICFARDLGEIRAALHA